MTRPTREMVNIYRIGLILLLIGFGSDSAHASTSHLQTYVSTSGSLILQQEKSSSFFFAQQMEDSIKVGDVDSIKLKDPNKAIFYAFIPGIIVHGAGHFYAGERTTGFLLLGSELVGATLILGGTSTGWGRSSPTRKGFTVALIGGTLFFGSWIYDIVKSPLVVQKQNQKLLQANHTQLKFEIRHKYLRLVTVWRF